MCGVSGRRVRLFVEFLCYVGWEDMYDNYMFVGRKTLWQTRGVTWMEVVNRKVYLYIYIWIFSWVATLYCRILLILPYIPSININNKNYFKLNKKIICIGRIFWFLIWKKHNQAKTHAHKYNKTDGTSFLQIKSTPLSLRIYVVPPKLILCMFRVSVYKIYNHCRRDAD